MRSIKPRGPVKPLLASEVVQVVVKVINWQRACTVSGLGCSHMGGGGTLGLGLIGWYMVAKEVQYPFE